MNTNFNKQISNQCADCEAYMNEDFASLFEKHNALELKKEGSVVKGIITAIDKDTVTVDIGIKDEGRIPIREFVQSGKVPDLKIGDEIEVYIKSYENRHGKVVLSREKAVKESGWQRLEDSLNKKEPVNGIIVGRVKGGLMVDLDGIIAFLPGSQVDTKPIKDISFMMGVEQPFLILKADREQGNIIVSRKAILEDQRKDSKTDSMSKLSAGEVVEGVVKNITDYGAFVDLGAVDGLLHVTDISWTKTGHPSEVLSVGQSVKVKIIKCDEDTGRISLGMKQLEKNPWEGIDKKYPVGTKMKGKVTSVTDYGVFIELEHGVEGLAHVSELSWTRSNLHPSKMFHVGQEVEFMVLEMDIDKHRISLGIKQCSESIWQNLEKDYPVGKIIDAKVAEVLKTSLIVNLADDVTGFINAADISWTESPKKAIQNYKAGDVVKAIVLSLDQYKGRITLGIKQLEEDPFEESFKNLKTGEVVTCTVKSINKGGIVVEVEKNISVTIVKQDLSSEKVEQRPERFAVGDRVDAKIVVLDKINRKVILSIKALELDEQKRKISEYGSVTSGASLGDVLGEAISTFEMKKAESVAVPAEETGNPKKKATKKKAEKTKKE